MRLISLTAAEELSEEDQKLKSELDMLAERIQASSEPEVQTIGLTNTLAGERRELTQGGFGGCEGFYQDIYFLHDCRAQTSQIPQTTLSRHGKDI